MTQPAESSMFIEKESFARRRYVDAARLLPVLSIILLAIPGYFVETVNALLLIFTVWAVLIILAGLLSWRLSRSTVEPELTEPDSIGPT